MHSTNGRACLTKSGRHNNPKCNDGEICAWILDPKMNWTPTEQCIKSNAINNAIISKNLELEITQYWIQTF